MCWRAVKPSEDAHVVSSMKVTNVSDVRKTVSVAEDQCLVEKDGRHLPFKLSSVSVVWHGKCEPTG